MIRSALSALLALTGLTASASLPKVGEPAPAFSAPDAEGRTVSLSDFKGAKTVVLYFYPKDDTPGCTAQACSLRDGHGEILATGAVVLGVSADDAKSHGAFAAKHRLPFPLLADPERKLIQAYGVGSAMGFARRVTFIIDRQGILRHVVEQVRTRDHDRQILELLRAMK